MSFSLSARNVLTITGLLGIVALASTVGCAAPGDENVGESASALNDNGESADAFDWTITVAVTKPGGEPTATATFDDNATGGKRNGGVCLATDLDLGKCDTIADCDSAAEAAGLPKSKFGGVQHYCVGAGSEGQKRCWTRPGPAFTFAPGKPPKFNWCSTRTGITPGGTLSIKADYPSAQVDLSNASQWTAVGCLAGATGTPEGNGCQSNQANFNVADHFITVK